MTVSRARKKIKINDQSSAVSTNYSCKDPFPFINLPRDIMGMVMVHTPFSSFVNGSLVSKFFYRLFRGPQFWVAKILCHIPNANVERFYTMPSCDWSSVYRVMQLNEEISNDIDGETRKILFHARNNNTQYFLDNKFQTESPDQFIDVHYSALQIAGKNHNESILKRYYDHLIEKRYHYRRASINRYYLYANIITLQPLRKIRAVMNRCRNNEFTHEQQQQFLKYACTQDYVECLDYLINECGIMIDWSSPHTINMLCNASRLGHVRTLKILLSHKPPTDLHELDDTTPIECAAMNGQTLALQMLLEYGMTSAPVNEGDQTHLHLAAKGGHVDCVSLLISFGADINAKFEYQLGVATPLCFAAESGSYKCFELLLQKGARTYAGSDGEENHVYPLICAAIGGNIIILQEVLSWGVNVNCIADNEDSALFFAITYGYTACVKILLDAGANPNYFPEDGKGAVYLASKYGFADCLKLLIDKDADVELAQLHLPSLLKYPIKAGNVECLRLLLEANANPNINFDSDDISPLELTIFVNNVECAKQLIDFGARLDYELRVYASYVMFAVKTNCIDILHLLLSRGANPNVRDDYGEPPLFVAAYRGKIECITLLMKFGANKSDAVSVRGATFLNQLSNEAKAIYEAYQVFVTKHQRRGLVKITALDIAEIMGHQQAVSVLCTYNKRTKPSDTVISKIFTFYGRNPHQRDSDNIPPLLHAIIADDYHGVKHLAESGACIYSQFAIKRVKLIALCHEQSEELAINCIKYFKMNKIKGEIVNVSAIMLAKILCRYKYIYELKDLHERYHAITQPRSLK